MITLRPEQQDDMQALRLAFTKHRRVAFIAPTGYGKTQLAAAIAASANAKGNIVYFVLHRDFLLQQTSGTLERHDVPHSFIASGYHYNPFAGVLVCSIDTIRNRLARLPPPHLMIIDECHRSPSKTWSRVIEWAGKAKILGLTATPIRLDGKGLNTQFETMVLGPSVSWLIERGLLSDYRAFAPTSPDLGGIHIQAGDYVVSELEDIMDRSAIVGDLVSHYKKHANGCRALYFGVSIRHSEHIAAAFNANGVPAIHLDGASPTAKRIEAAVAMAEGRIKVISNVGLTSEGYDLSAQSGMDVTIDCVGLARPTKSLTLYLQAVGRALRPKATPAIILDHAGCTMKFGLPDDPREWSLDGAAKTKRDKDNGPPVRQCLHCFAVHRAHLTVCPYCGHPHEIQSREVEEIAGELGEVKRRPMDRERQTARTLDGLIALATARGYRSPEKWARIIHDARERKAQEWVEQQARSYGGYS